MLLVTAWAFLLMPVLCAGGVLLHECSTCAPGVACNHESNCLEDPCSPILTRSDDGPRVPTDLAPITLPLAAEIADEWIIAAGGARPQDSHAQSIRTSRYADSGLPLLN
jgi:hypothetical protein